MMNNFQQSNSMEISSSSIPTNDPYQQQQQQQQQQNHHHPSMYQPPPSPFQQQQQQQASGDPLIVLDVGGRIFKCHRSTLLNSGSHYFTNRFGGRFDSRAAYVDSNGLHVYFLERSGTLFEYVFQYLVSLKLELPAFHENPVLWRNLRSEALYFGLESLHELLKITYACRPNTGNQGLLYWLGTRRGTTDYKNPYSIGQVHVGGWVDDSRHAEEYLFGLAGGNYSRKSFVQYRAEPKDMDFSEMARIARENGEEGGFDLDNVPVGSCCRLLDCDHGGKRLPAVLDLKEGLMIRPTHFSLRASLCLGLDADWNLEASNDGITWHILHAARDEAFLRLRGELANGKAAMRYVQRVFFEELELHQVNNQEAMDVLVEFLEREQRHTYELQGGGGAGRELTTVTASSSSSSPTSSSSPAGAGGAGAGPAGGATTPGAGNNFYRYFRIIGAEEIGQGGCLHCEGIEIYGDVYEA